MIGIKGIERVKLKIKALLAQIEDVKPVFERFITFYQQTIKRGFDRTGAPFGDSWAAYSPRYAKWKAKNKSRFPGSRKLVLTGAMFRASQGGAGWFQKVDGKSAAFGITTIIPYAKTHQEGRKIKGGEIPQRAWFYNKDNKSIPNAALLFLQKELTAEFKKAAENG